MSKEIWNSINPPSGTGTVDIKVGGTIHTGRSQRTSTPIFKPEDAAITGLDKILTVVQEAKPEFVAITDVSIGKEGGNVVVTGKSNSSKLAFSLGEGDIPVTLPPNFSAGGVTARNNSPIPGDPGAAAEFEFTITVPIPANTAATSRTKIINVAAAGGQSAAATITQSAGEPALSLSKDSVTVPAEGTPVTVTVNSNIQWKAE